MPLMKLFSIPFSDDTYKHTEGSEGPEPGPSNRRLTVPHLYLTLQERASSRSDWPRGEHTELLSIQSITEVSQVKRILSSTHRLKHKEKEMRVLHPLLLSHTFCCQLSRYSLIV